MKNYCAGLGFLIILAMLSACTLFPPLPSARLENNNGTPTTDLGAPSTLIDTVFSAYAFVDANANGRLDEGDLPLEGAAFTVQSFGDTTNADGYAMILIPSQWDEPVTARMAPPPGSQYVPIGAQEVDLQNGIRNQAAFLFAPPLGASPTITPVQIDLVYCTTSDGVKLTMDLYRPKRAGAPAPLIVHIHGGGWTGGDKSDGVGLIFKEELTRRGYVYASINYRLAPKYTFPAPIEDVKCAIRHLRANAEKYGIDPQRIGVIGGSAGGHLAALLGVSDTQAGWDVGEYLDQSSRVQAVVDLYGPADLPAMLAQSTRSYALQVFGATSNQDPVLGVYSPVTYISPDDSPFLILHGDQDEVVPLAQSEILYERLKSSALPVELVVVKNAGHSFHSEANKIDPDFPALFQMVGDFFDRYLR